jgi:hypothetical protein
MGALNLSLSDESAHVLCGADKPQTASLLCNMLPMTHVGFLNANRKLNSNVADPSPRENHCTGHAAVIPDSSTSDLRSAESGLQVSGSL